MFRWKRCMEWCLGLDSVERGRGKMVEILVDDSIREDSGSDDREDIVLENGGGVEWMKFCIYISLIW